MYNEYENDFQIGGVMSYSTKQKELILDVIKSKKKEFTIKDIFEEIDGVGLTTVYRLVDKLVEEKVINKTIGKDNVTYYEYLEHCDHDNHFYLKCDICKKLEHVDCDCINDLYEHISKEHSFKLNKENIIINGICKKCQEKCVC